MQAQFQKLTRVPPAERGSKGGRTMILMMTAWMLAPREKDSVDPSVVATVRVRDLRSNENERSSVAMSRG
uniref:Kinesin motor domain-containing protein n=1 Tax=Panagrellus redivivus TaxID=6233 RepID=A0A7E4ZW46_PANRE